MVIYRKLERLINRIQYRSYDCSECDSGTKRWHSRRFVERKTGVYWYHLYTCDGCNHTEKRGKYHESMS